MPNQTVMALTVAEFCDKYRIHPATYYRNVKRGSMPASIKVGSSTRILVADEQAWLEKSRSSHPDEQAA